MPDALDRLRELRREDALPDPDAQRRARAAMLRHIEQDQVAATTRHRRRRRWVAAFAVPAAAAALLIAAMTGIERGGVSPEAATALERAADAAEVRAPDLPPGKYLYVRVQSSAILTLGDDPVILPSGRTIERGAPFSVLRSPTIDETWMDRDGNGRYASRQPAGELEFPGPRDRRRWVAQGRPDLTAEAGSASGEYRTDDNGFPVGDGRQLKYEDIAALPTGGEAMHAKLVELAGDRPPDREVAAFEIVGDLLRFAPVPRRVRAALYRATARIDGVRLVGVVRDGLGRRGQAVEIEHDGIRHQLVFDPETSALLAQRDVLAERQPWIDAGPGYMTNSRLVERQAVVGSARRRP